MIYENSLIAVIIIGRNEGERLTSCINSAAGDNRIVVYVDSASTDNSANNARELGVNVLELDMSIPFTAARARNAGFEHLIGLVPDVEYVQFVDGDCTLDSDWLAQAETVLKNDENVAVVCGRRREVKPEISIYNYLCDQEWDTPVGIAKACGGDFMIRASVFAEVNGFNDKLIAGEEPELCIRIRQLDFLILRIDAEMTKHDANIIRFGQWWKRCVRAGYAFAEGAYLYGSAPEFHWVKESNRSWFWACILPSLLLVLAFFNPIFVLGISLYLLQIIRVAFRKGIKRASSLQYGFFLVLSKFPELQGQVLFWFKKLFKRTEKLIEYK